MNRAGAINQASNDDPLQSFRDWQQASAIRRVAEARGDDHSGVIHPSAEVIPLSGALTLDLRHPNLGKHSAASTISCALT